MVPIVSVIIGALLTASAAFTGAFFQNRREHAKWVREKQHEAYRELLLKVSAYELVKLYRSDQRELDGLWFEMQECAQVVSLLGPTEVVKAVQALDVTEKDTSKSKLKLMKQMRKALKVKTDAE